MEIKATSLTDKTECVLTIDKVLDAGALWIDAGLSNPVRLDMIDKIHTVDVHADPAYDNVGGDGTVMMVIVQGRVFWGNLVGRTLFLMPFGEV